MKYHSGGKGKGGGKSKCNVHGGSPGYTKGSASNQDKSGGTPCCGKGR